MAASSCPEVQRSGTRVSRESLGDRDEQSPANAPDASRGGCTPSASWHGGYRLAGTCASAVHAAPPTVGSAARSPQPPACQLAASSHTTTHRTGQGPGTRPRSPRSPESDVPTRPTRASYARRPPPRSERRGDSDAQPPVAATPKGDSNLVLPPLHAPPRLRQGPQGPARTSVPRRCLSPSLEFRSYKRHLTVDDVSTLTELLSLLTVRHALHSEVDLHGAPLGEKQGHRHLPALSPMAAWAPRAVPWVRDLLHIST